MESVKHRFTQLLSLALDDECSEAEREEFAQLEREHPELLAGCVEMIFTHSLLQWQCEDISECMALERLASHQEATVEGAASGATRNAWRLWGWAAAAILLVASGVLVWRPFHRMPAANVALAEIVEQNAVDWAADSTALRSGNLVFPGRLTANAGSFTMRFHSGPTVHVVGPASMNIESKMLVYLDRGQATARVPESSRGFAIKTPVAKVVDQGTVFGVAARDDGKTDVVVFDGRVDVHETAGALLQPKSLIKGEAARIDDQGAIDRIMQVGRDASGGWWTADHPAPHDAVIRLVRDNIPTNNSSRYFCYQITYRGLADDVFAYPDHPHQWNGLTGDGLPDFLRGADYVQTFNDYRYLNDFEMVVELSQPADLYVFFDDRVPAPEWLEAEFDDTGVDVGLDEGPWVGIPDEYLATVPKRSHGVGGGKSIDTKFSVWHRRCTDTMPVTLGPVGVRPNKFGRAMYGIAATPLDARSQVPRAIEAISGR